MFSQPNVVGSGRWYVSFYSHVLYCFSGSLAFVSNFKALFSQVRPKMGSYSAVMGSYSALAGETLILQCSTCPSAVDWLASIGEKTYRTSEDKRQQRRSSLTPWNRRRAWAQIQRGSQLLSLKSSDRSTYVFTLRDIEEDGKCPCLDPSQPCILVHARLLPVLN